MMTDEQLRHAACRDADPDVFFPSQGDAVGARAAQAICSRCPIIRACADEALARPTADDSGVWGGLTEHDRTRLRSRRYRRGAA